jgi:hypothetical protein
MKKTNKATPVFKRLGKVPDNYTSIMTESFRTYAARVLGTLDTARTFMYLFLRFEQPTLTNKDDYKTLFTYILQFEDLIVSIHGSYYEHVYFNLFIPKKRYDIVRKNHKKFINEIYSKTIGTNIPFMPYSVLPWKNSQLTPEISTTRAKETWKKINIHYEKYFSKEQQNKIEAQGAGNTDQVTLAFLALRPFEEMLCKKFHKLLSKEQVDRLHSRASITEIPKLDDQCIRLLNEFKKGVFVRDVQLNINGYESKQNPIKD